MEKPIADRVVLVPRRRREPAVRLVERDEHDLRLYVRQPYHALARLWFLRFAPTPDSRENLAPAVAPMERKGPLSFGQGMHAGEAYSIDEQVGQLGQFCADMRLVGKAPQNRIWAEPVASCVKELVPEHQYAATVQPFCRQCCEGSR